ncbi:MAG: SDR family NAD(P)-dependent oxidoreductase [Oscillospiraceae bacterium]
MLKIKKTALVTGGSSGIGLSASKALCDAGVTVYEISRRESSAPGINHISGDVTDEAAMKAAVEQVIAAEGGLDILVCCAGFGISGAVEFTELADAKRQLDVNFFGVVNTVKAALPVMRSQNGGRIVLISSVAGAIAIPFQTYYSVSKAAINSYACALRNEVRPYGISVCAVMPGDIATGFTDAREKSPAGDGEYGGRISRSVSKMEKDERGGMSPDTAGAFIRRMCLKKRVPPTCSIGFVYKFFTMLVRLLPAPLVSKLVYILYAK